MSYYSEIMRLKPLRYYPLNDAVGSGTAKDASGNGQDGTVNGGVTFGQSPIIKASVLKSALFDGSSGDIDLPLSGLPTGNATWTFLLWIIASTHTARHYAFSLGNEVGFQQRETSGVFHLAFNVANNVVSTLATTPGHTYFLAATYDQTTTTLYVFDATSGTSDVQALVQQTNFLSYGNASIGSSNESQFWWSANVAHKAILSYALTANQIAWLYHVGQGAGILQGNHRSFARVF